jgi:NAD(P)-dependent dehydrogenase (short-subunit alcohol dehydrogenase family)
VAPRKTNRWIRAASCLLVVALAASCSDGDDAGEASAPSATEAPTGETTTTAPESGEPPEQYSGPVDDFYVVPEDLGEGEPGQLIRVQHVGESDGYVHLRVMYRSRDARGQDRAVTGRISYPTAEAPEEGWPVITTANGTVGLGSKCAISRGDAPAPGYGVEGVHVASDYVGMGPVGEVHPYLSGLSEAQPVIDIVRAARLLPDAHAGDRWLAVGHSQGGHAALFTHEIAEEYAPELEHLGTVVSAPAAALDRRFGPDDEVVPRMVALMALYGIAQDNPEIDPRHYVNADVASRDEIITTGCTQDVIDAFVTIPPDELYTLDPMDDPEARAIVMENDPGTVATDVPMLLLYGDLDWWVVPDRVRFVFDRLCGLGQEAALVNVATGDHGNLLSEGAGVVTDFLEARLAGAVHRHVRGLTMARISLDLIRGPQPSLDGRRVLITGAARGIGAALAERLHQRGARVALVGLEPERMAEVADRCGGAPWATCDVGDRLQVERAVDEAVGALGGLDVVVANAGIAAQLPLVGGDPAIMEATVRVNLLGAYYTVRAAGPHVSHPGGYALVVSSLGAAVNLPLMGAYSASKAGVEALGNTLRVELRPSGATDMTTRGFGTEAATVLTGGGSLSKTTPLEVGIDALERGIARRSKRIVAPWWAGLVLPVRMATGPFVEWYAQKNLAEALRIAREEHADLTTEQPS